jgi:hypothetical protein
VQRRQQVNEELRKYNLKKNEQFCAHNFTNANRGAMLLRCANGSGAFALA